MKLARNFILLYAKIQLLVVTEKPSDLFKNYLVQVAFLLCMKPIIKQENKSRKSSKHTRQLSKLKSEFLAYYSKLPIQKLAADFVGKDEDTIIRWKKNDKGFADQVASAKSAWALENAGKVKSKEWLLERIMKEHFAERKELEIGASEKIEEMVDRLKAIQDYARTH